MGHRPAPAPGTRGGRPIRVKLHGKKRERGPASGDSGLPRGVFVRSPAQDGRLLRAIMACRSYWLECGRPSSYLARNKPGGQRGGSHCVQYKRCPPFLRRVLLEVTGEAVGAFDEDRPGTVRQEPGQHFSEAWQIDHRIRTAHRRVIKRIDDLEACGLWRIPPRRRAGACRCPCPPTFALLDVRR
jgi:hypothetical protein